MKNNNGLVSGLAAGAAPKASGSNVPVAFDLSVYPENSSEFQEFVTKLPKDNEVKRMYGSVQILFIKSFEFKGTSYDEVMRRGAFAYNYHFDSLRDKFLSSDIDKIRCVAYRKLGEELFFNILPYFVQNNLNKVVINEELFNDLGIDINTNEHKLMLWFFTNYLGIRIEVYERSNNVAAPNASELIDLIS